MSKHDRIMRLAPLFEQGRIVLPRTRYRALFDNTTTNLVDDFVEQDGRPAR
jgi:hypothetical protein